MLFPKRVKQFIAGTAGMMFLLCYNAGFAQGCSTSLHAPEKSEMPPCHMVMGDESGAASKSTTPADSGLDSTSRCHDVASFQADHSIPDWSTVFIVAVAETFTTSFSAPPPHQPPSLRVKPPPLRLLHCCLRN